MVGGHGEDGEGSECTPTDHRWWAWPPRGHAHNTQHSPTAALTTQQWVGLRVGHAQWVWPHTANGCPRQHPAGGASVLAPPSGRAHPQPIGPPQCPEGGASDWLLPLGVATLPMSLKNTQWAGLRVGPSQWAWPNNKRTPHNAQWAWLHLGPSQWAWPHNQRYCNTTQWAELQVAPSQWAWPHRQLSLNQQPVGGASAWPLPVGVASPPTDPPVGGASAFPPMGVATR